MTGRSEVSPDPASTKLQLLRLNARLKTRIRHADQESIDFARACLKQISRMRGNHFVDMRYECLEQCVPYFYGIGHLEDALDAALLMQELAAKTENADALRRAYNFLGIIRAELGDVSSAVIAYHRALHLAREIGCIDGVAPVLLNLGAVLYYGGLFHDAIATFERGLSLAHQTVRCDEFITNFSANLARVHFRLGEPATAYQYMLRARGSRFVPTTVKDFFTVAHRELLFVEIALALGHFSEAKEHSARCRDAAMRSGGMASCICSKLADALVCSYGGNLDLALKSLQECVEDSGRQGFQSRLNALTVATRGFQTCGRPDLALRYFQEVLISIRQQRQAQLHALISLDLQTIGRRNDEASDLCALAYTEASLRAEASELELENAQHEMLERLAVTASLKEDPSASHGYRVGALSSALAAEMEWSRKDRYEIEIAGRLHDIGKVAIPDSITLGARFLDQAERELMRSHCIVGYELLSNSSAHGIQLAAQVARCHHEWWNGCGYPAGLHGERIPLASRIVALADVFDAMTHGRRYSAALPIEKALDEIASLAGQQFDPHLVPVFASLVRNLVREHTDLDRYLGAAASTSPFFTARKRISALLGAESNPVTVA